MTANVVGDQMIYNKELIGGSGIGISSQQYWTEVSLNLRNNREFQDLQNRLTEIEEQLLILKPNEVLQAKYPALQEAYDAYKIIEKLVNDEVNNETSK
jgi:hypothetical protein